MKNLWANKRSIIIYLVFIIWMVGVLHSKQNFYVDEVLSYGLANDDRGLAMRLEETVSYKEPARPFIKYMTVSEDEAFDYQKVWKNQAGDVHPPLYYVILHTISSLFPEQFSIWYAGIINIVFAIFSLVVLRKLADELKADAFTKEILSIVFVFAPGILSMISFLRMYVMAMFWVTLVAYFFVKATGIEWRVKDYILLFMISVLSALTHYYCVVFLVLICIVYGVWLLIKKRWKATTCFVVTMIASAITAIAVFPAMIKHVFSGYRGTDSIANFTDTSVENYWERLKGFYEFLDEHLLGGVLPYAVAFLMILTVCSWYQKKKHIRSIMQEEKRQDDGLAKVKWALLFVPSVLYFLLVAKMAVAIDERYISLIFPIVLLLLVCGISFVLRKHSPEKVKNIGMVLVCAVVIVNGWHLATWDYLYLGSQEKLEKVEEFSDVECVVVYEWQYMLHQSFLEIAQYDSVTFLGPETMYWLLELDCAKDSELVLMVVGKDESTIEIIQSMRPQLQYYEKINEFGYGTTYYMWAEEEINAE